MFRKLVLTLALVLTAFLAIASTAFAVFPPLEPRSVAGPTSAHGFVLPGDSISTGLAATAGDPTLVSLTNNSRGAVDVTLTESTCPNDPLCSTSPIFVGRMIAEVAIAGTGATDIALTSRAASFTATLRYDKSIVPALNVSALHVYADGTRVAGCDTGISVPCVRSTKVLSGSKDLEIKVALRASAKLMTTLR